MGRSSNILGYGVTAANRGPDQRPGILPADRGRYFADARRSQPARRARPDVRKARARSRLRRQPQHSADWPSRRWKDDARET